MTQTLTTEQLKARIAHYRELAYRYGMLGRPKHEAQYRNDAEFLEELLANREAQPVSDECAYDVYANGKSACVVDIPKEKAEVICRGISEVTGCKVDWHYIGGRVHIKALAPPAPAVPDEQTWDELCRQNPEMTIGDAIIRSASWNACRAAMLAQPVSQRYKLPEGFKLMPIEMTDEIAEAIAMEARCCGGIALCIYEAALAAAPEGDDA